MSEPLLDWTPVSGSLLRRRLLQAAGALCCSCAAALACAAAATAGAGVWVLAAAALGAAASGFTLVRRAHSGAMPRGRLRVAADGGITWQDDVLPLPMGAPAADSRALVPRALSPWVLELSDGKRRIALWRDSVPAAAFRRLTVVARWRIERRPQPATA